MKIRNIKKISYFCMFMSIAFCMINASEARKKFKPEQPTNTISFITSDKKTIEITQNQLQQFTKSSITMKNFMEDIGSGFIIRSGIDIPINSKTFMRLINNLNILNKVILSKHFENAKGPFHNIPDLDLFELIIAANWLEMQKLLDVSTTFLAQRIPRNFNFFSDQKTFGLLKSTLDILDKTVKEKMQKEVNNMWGDNTKKTLKLNRTTLLQNSLFNSMSLNRVPKQNLAPHLKTLYDSLPDDLKNLRT